MFTVTGSETVEMLGIIKIIISVWSIDWQEADEPEWTKEKAAKALEIIIEVLLLFLNAVT